MHRTTEPEVFLDVFADSDELERMVDHLGIGVRLINEARDTMMEVRREREGFKEEDYRQAAELLKRELAHFYVQQKLAVKARKPR